MISRRLLFGGTAAVAAGGAAALYATRQEKEPPAPPAMDGSGRLLWRNWSGSCHAYPSKRIVAAREEDVVEMMRAFEGAVRAVGSGHSFTPLVPTDGALVSLDRMSGVVEVNKADVTARVRAGTRLGDLGAALAAAGQDMPNLPDINKQALAGALATGTHGTGKGLKALHGEVVSFRLVTPQGDVLTCSLQENADIFHAARVGLGAFGIVTEVTLRNRPLARVRKVVSMLEQEEVLAAWPRLIETHRNVEFYLIPFTQTAVLITLDPTDEPVKPRLVENDDEGLMDLKRLRDWLGFSSTLRRTAARSQILGLPPQIAIDEGWKLMSNERGVRFNEMEYHLPLEAQMPALREIMGVIEAHRSDVFFPIECRIIEADDAWLSPFHGRRTGSIAVHAYYKDDYSFLFELVEPIFRRHGGRPHWGKHHSLKRRDFAALYPRFNEADAVRRSLDPKGRMLNPWLEATFNG